MNTHRPCPPPPPGFAHVPCPACGGLERHIEPLRWWVKSYDAWFNRAWICARCGCRYRLGAEPRPEPVRQGSLLLPLFIGVGALGLLLFVMLLAVVFYALQAG